MTKVDSDGGPSGYYDFDPEWTTANDLIEYKCGKQWAGPWVFHLCNIFKALYRWGDKDGTTIEYDARKIIYSGVRILMLLEGNNGVRQYLQELLDDPQFAEDPPFDLDAALEDTTPVWWDLGFDPESPLYTSHEDDVLDSVESEGEPEFEWVDIREIDDGLFYPETNKVLWKAFHWHKTPQGHDFWKCCALGKIPESEWRPIVDKMFEGLLKDQSNG